MSDAVQAAMPDSLRTLFVISARSSFAQELGILLPAGQPVALYDGCAVGETEPEPLILIDCADLRWSQVTKELMQLQKQTAEASVALYAVAAVQDVAEALKWPVLSGIFTDDMDAAVVRKGLQELLAGRYWFSRHQMNQLASFRQAPKVPASEAIEALSPREMEVLNLTSQGKSNADIAKSLFLSQHTVKTHLYNLYRKIGVVNRTQAVHWYQEHIS